MNKTFVNFTLILYFLFLKPLIYLYTLIEFQMPSKLYINSKLTNKTLINVYQTYKKFHFNFNSLIKIHLLQNQIIN